MGQQCRKDDSVEKNAPLFIYIRGIVPKRMRHKGNNWSPAIFIVYEYLSKNCEAQQSSLNEHLHLLLLIKKELNGGPQRDTTRIVHQLTKNCLNPQGTDTCAVCTPYRLTVAQWRKEIAEHPPTEEERIELHDDMQRQKYAHSYKQMEEINRRKREVKGDPPPTVGP